MSLKGNETDPRVIRTHQLIQDAFTSLIKEKDFEDITVKEIAENATVNRATFYAHFVDKYEILDSKISESFTKILMKKITGHEAFNEETIRSIFLAVCDFHSELSTLCKRSYRSLGTLFEQKVKDITQITLFKIMLKDMIFDSKEQLSIKTVSVMLSWGMYGAAYSWNNEGHQISAESFVELNMPFLINGIKELLH